MQPGTVTNQPPVAAGPGQLVGVTGWERGYFNEHGNYQRTSAKVPVNGNGELAGKPYACPKCKDTIWLPAATRTAPVCTMHPARKTQPVPLKPPTIRQQIGDFTGRLVPLAPVLRVVDRPLRPVWALIAGTGTAIIVDAADVPALPFAAAPLAGYGAYRAVRAWKVRGATRKGSLEVEDPDGGKRLRAAIDRASRTVGYSIAGAVAALGAAAACGLDVHGMPGWLSVVALAGAWLLPAATWWRVERERRNQPKPVPAPVVVDEPRPLTADELSAAEAAAIWKSEVAEPGTMLDQATWQRIACGWQAVVVATKRGALNRLSGELNTQAIRRIAAAYDVRKSAVTWIEEFDDSPNKALLLVQPTNPLAEGQVWGGPKTIDFERGVAESGRFIDGTVMTEVLFKYGWGAPGESISGTTGGGKSERIRKRLVVERWSSFVDPAGVRRGAFITILHDPKRMESYAEFRRALHGYGTTRDDAHLIIDALLRECYRRYDHLASLDWRDELGRERGGGVPWDPRVHGPIISAYWDEFHILAGDSEFVKKAEELARMQRACAMRSTMASHMMTLGDTGSQALRDMLAGGRATLFRTTSGLTATLATGGQLTADPRSIPKSPGMCLVADGEAKTLMGRESYIPREEEDAKRLGVRSLYDWLFDADNNPIGYPAVIPPETAEAFGAEFMEWMEAGKQRGGRIARPAGPARPVREQIEVKADLKSVDAVRAVLVEAGMPLDTSAIEDALFGAGTPFKTRTITGALTELVKQRVAVKGGTAKTPTYMLASVEDGDADEMGGDLAA